MAIHFSKKTLRVLLNNTVKTFSQAATLFSLMLTNIKSK